MDLTPVSEFLSANEAGKFIDNLANPNSDILQKAQALYVAHQGRLPSPPAPEQLQPSKMLRGFVVEFSNGMRNFLARTQDEEAKEAFNCKCWEELQGEAAKAVQALDSHNKKRRNWRNPFEAADKLGGIVARRIEFLIELVPDGDYTRILAGALKLLYNTAKRKKDIREKIVETLDSLSDTISHTKSEIKLYSRDMELREKSEDLYMAILDFVRHAVSYLDKSSAVESFKAFFQQKRYGSKLEDAIENIEKTSYSFENCVSVCFQRRVQNIDRNVASLRHPLVAMYFLLAGIVKDFPSQLEQLKAEMRNAATEQTIQFMQIPSAQPTITAQHLRQLLSTDWRAGTLSITEDLLPIFKADVQTAFRFVPSQLNQEQLGLLLSDNGFMIWLKSLASQLIVIHDEKSLEGNSSLSTLSYLCALISEMLASPGMFPLNFFCGLHSAAGSTLEGGSGVMRSLALQLLQIFGSTDFLTPNDPNLIVQGLMVNDLATICSVFAMLLQNIPAGVVYVMIDGSFWYSTEARSDDMKAVIIFLNQLVVNMQAAGRGLALKVLITNPASRQRYSWGVQALDIHLEHRLLTGGHSGIANRILAIS